MSADTEILTKKRFTVEEFQRILDADIFPPDSRQELIRGEIIEMPNPSRRHSGRVNKLTRVFTSKLGESVIVCIQNGMFLNDLSEPKPDVVICKPLPELFGPFEPSPDDVLEVRRDPANGDYQSLELYKRGQSITARNLPGSTFTVDELLA